MSKYCYKNNSYSGNKHAGYKRICGVKMAKSVKASPVTADKLPMSPPAGGAQFGVPAWTIQPAGTRFDSPIEVTLPNASSQPAGDNLPIVQWDHDLGQYVAMGRATVSEDGAVLVTDSGSGITKAGWGGLCRYDPDKCGQNAPPVCKDCEKLDTSGDCPTCYKDPSKDGEKTPSSVKATVAFEREFDLGKGFLTSLAAKIGLPNPKVVSKFGVQGTSEEICCAAKNGTSHKLIIPTVFGAAEFQADWGVPGFSTPAGFDSLTKAGLYLKGKVGLNVIGSYTNNLCKDSSCDGLSLSGSVYGTLEGDIKLEDGGDIPAELRIKINALAVGGGVNGVFKCVGAACNVSGNAFWFAKSEITLGTRKIVLLNIGNTTELGAIPISGSQVCQSIDAAVGASN